MKGLAMPELAGVRRIQATATAPLMQARAARRHEGGIGPRGLKGAE
jgi:hypothetical protein